jgi:hypothetical protein
MDIDKIFNTFKPEKEPIGDDFVLIDFKDHPYYWVGMFKKIMLNHDVFGKKFISLFEDESNKIDIEKAGQHFVYELAWGYITKLNIEIPLHLNSLLQFKDSTLIKNLNKILLYFQDNEEYEKCGFILKLVNELEKN